MSCPPLVDRHSRALVRWRPSRATSLSASQGQAEFRCLLRRQAPSLAPCGNGRRRLLMSDISTLGLGLMGSALARSLVKGGHGVTVWNRSPAKMQPLVDMGAAPAASVAAAVEASPRRSRQHRRLPVDPSPVRGRGRRREAVGPCGRATEHRNPARGSRVRGMVQLTGSRLSRRGASLLPGGHRDPRRHHRVLGASVGIRPL